jgi:hypothetical protein
MKDSTELHTCGLEMKGGLASNIDYSQKFVRAPKSQFPGKPPAHEGKETPYNKAMAITLKA